MIPSATSFGLDEIRNKEKSGVSVKNILIKYFVLLLFIFFAASIIVECVNNHSVDKAAQDVQNLQASIISFYKKPARPALDVASLLHSGVVPESMTITAHNGRKILISDAWGGSYSVGPEVLPAKELTHRNTYYFIEANQVPTQVCKNLVERVKGFSAVEIGNASVLSITSFYSKSGQQKIAMDCVQEASSKGGASVRFIFPVKNNQIREN